MLCILMRLKRSVTLLRQSIGSLSQDSRESFEDSIHPSRFQDAELRKSIQDLHLNYDAPNHATNAKKKRKLSEESTDFLTILTHGIFETLQITPPSDDDVVMLEQIFL